MNPQVSRRAGRLLRSGRFLGRNLVQIDIDATDHQAHDVQDFLIAEAALSRKKYDHRRKWVEQRVRELAGWFAIDVLFVAWMANHFHLVLRNLPQLVETWSDEVVIRRSCLIFQYKFRRMGVRDGGGPLPWSLGLQKLRGLCLAALFPSSDP